MSKMRAPVKSIVAFLFSILLFISCTEINHEKFITGKWERMPLGDGEILVITRSNGIQDTLMNEWQFEDDGEVLVKLNQYVLINEEGLLIEDFGENALERWPTGTYEIKSEGSETFIKMDMGIGSVNYGGLWRIVQLDKDYLVIQRIEKADGSTDGAYLWREFKRIN